MIARTRTAVVAPDPSIRTGLETARPPRSFDPRRSRRRSTARKTRDRVRTVPPQPAVEVRGQPVTDWETLPFAFMLDPDFDQEDADLALGPALRLAHSVRTEEDDAFDY